MREQIQGKFIEEAVRKEMSFIVALIVVLMGN